MFEALPDKFSFPEAEQRVLRFWKDRDIFAQSIAQRQAQNADRFVFYEGPPTANGLPHPGHCLTRAMKDLFPRYQTMAGKLVERKAGWDTHGLPVEVEVCKELGIHTKEEITEYGVERFVKKCIESVFRYTREWEEMTDRLGFWINLDEAYVTYHQSYVESVWWGLKTLFERGLLYQGHKVVWWWAQGGTALSAGEVGEGYRTVDDPSVFVKFPVVLDTQRRAENQKMGGTGVSPVTSTRRPIKTGPDLIIRQRYLPHWEAGGSTYFITFRTRSGELSPAERTETLKAIAHFDADRYLLHAAVVMPDHAHALLTPLERGPNDWWPLAELLHSIKSYTAHTISKSRGASGGSIWMEEYFDRIIRSQADFDEKVNYILNNPAKNGLPEDYEWVWFEDAHAEAKLPTTGVARQQESDADSPELKDGRDARTTLARDSLPPNTSLLVWTTTPWTLISNHFAAVHPDLTYALVHDPELDEHLIIAADLVETIAKKLKRELAIIDQWQGTALVGLRYLPPFRETYYSLNARDAFDKKIVNDPTWANVDTILGDLVVDIKKQVIHEPQKREYIGWRVLAADFVTIDSGTGLVHEAPPFGEVDYNLWREESDRLVMGLPLLCAVNPDGTFQELAPEKYRNEWVKDCDKDIIRELKERGLLYHQEVYRHEYPFCPRAEDDALIQYARSSWFVRTSEFKDAFLANNAAIHWLPDHIKEGRFGDFLRNNVDWALSRERFWGTPLPIWKCEQTGQMEAIGSYDELLARPGLDGTQVWDDAKAADPKLNDNLRVHKPYIDAVTYDSPFAAGARMRRVPEVIDCWWDAGSMPFAQWGYPHVQGSKQRVQEMLPASFISEAIDQTRGWFYGLLAINTLLFMDGVADQDEMLQLIAEGSRSQPPDPEYVLVGATTRMIDPENPPEITKPAPLPYQTCIVLGHMMGEDGLKMSKRKKNYKEPSYIFDHLGADAMRWYFFSAQTPWTSVRFQEDAIRDAHRDFLVRLYNVLSFFNIYARIDGFVAHPQTGSPWRPTAERNELDRWIISELFRTTAFVREKLDAFENYPAAMRLNEFVDALSNWYVRRSRDRFWRSDKDQDKWDAYHTLYGVLLNLSMLIAPFTPFFAETMYQSLRGAANEFQPKAAGDASTADHAPIDVPGSELPESVHLCDYPTPQEHLIDEDLSAEMNLVRDIASLGRAARTSAKLKVRQPLASVEIVLANHAHEKWLESHKPLLAEELNVKQVDFTTDADHYVEYKVVPNFKNMGPKFGRLAPKIKQELGKLADPAAARRSLLDSGELSLAVGGESLALTPDDVEIRLEAKEGWSAAQGRAGVVVLSTEISDSLRDEGLINELIHHVQAARKELNLAYEARIALGVAGPDEFLAVVRNFTDHIAAECLVSAVTVGDLGAAEPRNAKVEDHDVRISVTPT